MILKLDQVMIPSDRIREDMGLDGVDEIAQSFKVLSQLQPIVVRPSGVHTMKYMLVSGQRRFLAANRLFEKGEAIKGLEVGQIKAELFDSAPEHVVLQMEFDENMKRQDFSFVEKSRFVTKYHKMMQEKTNGEWTQEHTAAALRLSQQSISYLLRLETAIKTDPNIAKAKTTRAAIKRMRVEEQRRARQVEVTKQDDGTVATRIAGILRLGDARECLREIGDGTVDAINFDPPWGDDASRKTDAAWGDRFDDSTESSDGLINTLLPELYRVLKEDRILIFWYRTWAYQDMVGRLEAAGFNLKFARTPCIWFKPDKITDQNRYPEKQLIDSYETFLLARKGDPVLHFQGRQNIFAYDRVPVAALIHPTEKPLALCAELLRLTTVPGELVLDPTAGSASFLHAALQSNRKALGFELSNTIHERATLRLSEYLATIKESA